MQRSDSVIHHVNIVSDQSAQDVNINMDVSWGMDNEHNQAQEPIIQGIFMGETYRDYRVDDSYEFKWTDKGPYL